MTSYAESYQDLYAVKGTTVCPPFELLAALGVLGIFLVCFLVAMGVESDEAMPRLEDLSKDRGIKGENKDKTVGSWWVIAA